MQRLFILILGTFVSSCTTTFEPPKKNGEAPAIMDDAIESKNSRTPIQEYRPEQNSSKQSEKSPRHFAGNAATEGKPIGIAESVSSIITLEGSYRPASLKNYEPTNDETAATILGQMLVDENTTTERLPSPTERLSLCIRASREWSELHKLLTIDQSDNNQTRRTGASKQSRKEGKANRSHNATFASKKNKLIKVFQINQCDKIVHQPDPPIRPSFALDPPDGG